jgi:hypothetical protein
MLPTRFQPLRLALEGVTFALGWFAAYRATLHFGASCVGSGASEALFCEDIYRPEGVWFTIAGTALLACALTSFTYHALQARRPRQTA